MEPRQKRILTILFVGVLMAALDIAIVGPALPAIQADFGIDSREMAWIFNIYVLFNLIGTPIMAKASDRFGRRAVYVIDITLFAIGSLILVLAPSFGVLLVGRAVQGLGAGGVFPVASAVIGDTLPREQRGRALGLIGAVFGLAFLIGPILGGILLRLSWHWLFLINLPIAVALIWQAWRWLPSSRAPATAPFDVAALLTALTVAITEFDSVGRASGLGSYLVALLAIGVVALLAVLMAVERRAADPIVRPALLKTRQMRLVGAIAIGTGVAESAAVFFPAMAVLALAVSEADASLLMLPLVLAMTLAAPAAGRHRACRAARRTVALRGSQRGRDAGSRRGPGPSDRVPQHRSVGGRGDRGRRRGISRQLTGRLSAGVASSGAPGPGARHRLAGAQEPTGGA